MDQAQIFARLEKLAELAKRGVGGERQTAQAMLEKMMAQHNITWAQLGVEEKVWAEFSIKTRADSALLTQVIIHVLQVDGFNYRKRGMWWKIEMTKMQELECHLQYDIYRRALRKEIDLCIQAFIHANKIYGVRSKEKQEPEKKLTAQERADMMRLSAMIFNMNPVTIRKAIT